MKNLIRQLITCLETGRPVAYCRLVETRGSTPQKAGAAMLVFPDGSQAGTLGGGCVEAEVKRRALLTLQNGQAEIQRFNLDSDYGWDDGLICGGRMMVLVRPLVEATDEVKAYFHAWAKRSEAGEALTEAVVFDSQASGVPATATFLFDRQDRAVASLGADGTVENVPEKVTAGLKSIAGRPRPYAAGGIGYLPLVERCRLVIVGGGHVGRAVADLAASVDFDLCVVDDRPEYVTADRFPLSQQRIAGPIDRVLPELEITPDTYCLIVTRGHNHDQEALYHLIDRGARYVGLIGSKRKIRMIFDNLRAEGVSSEALEHVFAPVGIDIGSQTVAEIAVSIVAELVAHRNREGEVPGRPERIAVASS